MTQVFGSKTQEEINDLLSETDNVLSELHQDLNTVEVRVPKSSPQVIKAIAALFGQEYVRSDGSAVITYEMFSQVNTVLRKAGKLKVKEYVA